MGRQILSNIAKQRQLLSNIAKQRQVPTCPLLCMVFSLKIIHISCEALILSCLCLPVQTFNSFIFVPFMHHFSPYVRSLNLSFPPINLPQVQIPSRAPLVPQLVPSPLFSSVNYPQILPLHLPAATSIYSPELSKIIILY